MSQMETGREAFPLEWRKIAPIPRKRGADPLVILLIDIGSLVCDIKQFHAQIETDICSGQIYGTKWWAYVLINFQEII